MYQDLFHLRAFANDAALLGMLVPFFAHSASTSSLSDPESILKIQQRILHSSYLILRLLIKSFPSSVCTTRLKAFGRVAFVLG